MMSGSASTDQGPFRRKLHAILCADVAGYTRLMAENESATHAAFKSSMGEIVDPLVRSHQGRIVKSTGDGFVAIFESVGEAVACAAAVQDRMGGRKGHGEGLRFRIGVNLGDVIVEENDVYGDGVNIAARLQALAPPGGVCVSTQVRDQVGGKLPLSFEDVGFRRVKKTDEPIHAYVVRAGGAGSSKREREGIARSFAGKSRRPFVIALLLAGVIGAGALGVSHIDLVPWLHRVSLGPQDQPTAYALPKEPSLVILPFKNIGADPEQEYFADGITEDLITDLARVQGLFVIARNSSFAYKNPHIDAREIGRQLGVRYLLEGSVRKADDTIRINVQLVEAASGAAIWAGRFDGTMNDVFKVQDQITRNIVSALSVKIVDQDILVAQAPRTNSAAAYDDYLRGLAQYRRKTYTDYENAVASFKRAIALDPDFSEAYAGLAATYLSARTFSWTNVDPYRSPLATLLNAARHDADLIANARQSLTRAFRTPSSIAYRAKGEILIAEGRHDDAINEIKKAIALDPNDADNLALLSVALTWAGRPAEALEPIVRAIRLNPRHPPIYRCYYGTAFFTLGRYEDATRWLQDCAADQPSNWPYIFLIATFAHRDMMGEAADARAQLDALLRDQRRSPLSVKEVRSVVPYRYQDDLLPLLVGLHKAGVPNALLSGP